MKDLAELIEKYKNLHPRDFLLAKTLAKVEILTILFVQRSCQQKNWEKVFLDIDKEEYVLMENFLNLMAKGSREADEDDSGDSRMN